MKTFSTLSARWPSLLTLLMVPLVFACGCTSALWDKETFAQHYRPASPVNLHLFYSKERHDVLVEYDESKEGDTNLRRQCYWLEPNTLRVNREQKPHFVSVKTTDGLAPIPVAEAAPQPTHVEVTQLYGVAGPDDDFFTLYSGEEKLESYKLPTYTAASQRVKQALLTPFAVAIDATIIGAVIGYYAAPQILAGWNR